MSYSLIAFVLAFGLFCGALALLEFGRRFGKRRLALEDSRPSAGLGAADGVIFGLLGLLIAFTFSDAASRFDDRRHLIVQEANAIGTAYLRLDLLQPGSREQVKVLFRRYLDLRLEIYKKLPNLEAARTELALSARMQSEIWSQAVEACRAEGSQLATMLLLPAINAMIDISTTRTAATQIHPPVIIFALLVVLAFAGSLLAGFGMAGARTRSWAHMLAFAAGLSIAAYVILDLEFPRLGLIRVDAFDQVLVDLRAGMK